MFGHCRWMWGWSRGCTPPKECCRVPPIYFWTTWHQTRAFLISLNHIGFFSAGLNNSKKGEVSGQIEWMGGWQFWIRRGVWADWVDVGLILWLHSTSGCWRLRPTNLWATWHQTRAFLISVSNKKWFFWLVWQFWKRRGVWGYWVDGGLIPWLHST